VIVVDVLELVDVDHDERHRGERTALRQNLVRQVDERAPHEHAGEIVGWTSDRQIAHRGALRLRIHRGTLADGLRSRAHERHEVPEQLGIELSPNVRLHDLERRLV
jgi:hypothetical protein